MTTSAATPDPAHAPLSKKGLWKWSVAFGAVILVYLMWQCGSALVLERKLADSAVKRFHDRLNAGDYEEIYRDADAGFRGQDHDNWIKSLEAVHNKLGLAGTAIQVNVLVDANTHGTLLTTKYRTAFPAGSATEVFTWKRNNTTLKLYGYHIQASALILDEEKPTAHMP